MLFSTRTVFFSFWCLLSVLLLAACNEKNKEITKKEAAPKKANPRNAGGQARPTDLADIRGAWVVKSLKGSDGSEVAPLHYYHLYIDAKAVRLPLDVNVCNSTYKSKQDSMVIDNMACTEACCDKEEGQAIAAFVASTLHFRKEDRSLFLSNAKGVMELFQPTLVLANSRWTAIGYKPNESAETKPTLFTKPYVLAFKDLRIALELDVNQCMTSYSYNAKTIHLPDLMGCSKACCDSKDGLLLRDMLKGKITYAIDGDRLTLVTQEYTIDFQMDNSELED